MLNVLIINGPNLNLTGRRNVAQYGTRSMEQIVLALQKNYQNVRFTCFQSNHEGCLIDKLQEAGTKDEESDLYPYDAVIINPGGLCHSSVSLRDTVDWLGEQEMTVVEVHLSNISEREPFRSVSLLSDVCTKTFYGLDAYEKAVSHIESAVRS
ncbi:MAG: 3-dehydroquinate dehydratase [Paludibacteraceae bacterium]|nr:3-dehydroquinate dehydratase [Paludibacteraceae bacterium]